MLKYLGDEHFSMKRSERGQSEVIGVVLLLGITIAAVTVTVATGSAALGLVTDEARSASVENGMSQLSSQSSLVALGGTDARRFDLGSVDGGQLRLDEEAGRVEVRIENGTDVTTTYNGSIGTLEYVGDRRNIAMQGGGVWAMEGGRGRMISPPEYHYRGETLTFPIVRLIGDESSPASGTGVVRRTAGDAGEVTETANPLRSGTVVVEVESEYYEGWYDFFTRRADGTVTKDDGNQTTTARLVVPEEVSFDRTLAVGQPDGYSHKGSWKGELSESEYVEGVSSPSPGPLIESSIESAADDNDNTPCVTSSGFDNCGTLRAGTYFINGDATVDGDLDFNTTDGNITVVVDGDFDVGNSELTVVDGSDNGVKYYVNGSIDFQGDGYVGTANGDIEAKRNQFYVSEGFLDGSQGDGTPTIEAIVYAPNADVVTKGNPTLRGAFVTRTLETGGSASVEYDPDLAEVEIRIAGGAGQNSITYLHVSENVVEVDFDR
jgi:flagellin-like protein